MADIIADKNNSLKRRFLDNGDGTFSEYTASGTGTPPAGTASTRVQGTAANGAAPVGDPVQNGFLAATINPAGVANAQMIRSMGDKIGRQVTTLISIRELYAQNTVAILNSTVETTVIAAAGAGVFHDVSEILLTNASAVATLVEFRDATAGTVRIPVWVPANATIPVNPITYITQAVANGNWTAQCSSATSDIRIFIQAVKNI